MKKGAVKSSEKREEGNIYVTFTFLYIAPTGEITGNWTWHFFMTLGLKPVTLGTWVISSGWLQSWPDLLCPLGNKFNTRSSEQCGGLFRRFSAAQLLVRGYFGPSATLSKPAALQNVALFQTIPLPL